MSSLSDDMRSSPLKEHESFRGTIYLRADLVTRQQGLQPTISLVREHGACARD
jgi:hypothetical protein